MIDEQAKLPGHVIEVGDGQVRFAQRRPCWLSR